MKWAVALLVALAACPKGGDKPKPIEHGGKGDGHLFDDDAAPATLAPAPPLPAVPAGLPALPALPRVTPEAVALGEQLFRDERVSAMGSRSCASCHDPAHGYSGNVANAASGKPNLRRTPSLVNLAWAKEFGWDGRYASFADHLAPHMKGQLGDAPDAVAARLVDVPLYRLHFARVGGEPRDAIVQGLEAFVLTRYAGDSRWDRMERTALTNGSAAVDPIVAGYRLFTGKAQCAVCHPPPLYTDGGYHTVEANPYNDPGRKGAFKTPTLRGAAARTSFFHTGGKTSLADVVAYYQTVPDLKIKLSADEAKQLVAFLEALTVTARM